VRALSLSRAPRRPLAGWLGIRRFLLVLGLVAIGGVLLLALTWRGVAFLKLGQEIGEMESEEARLVAERKELELARARLTSPDRIEAWARENLGMTTLQPGQFQVIQ